jgi:hypothetical protein
VVYDHDGFTDFYLDMADNSMSMVVENRSPRTGTGVRAWSASGLNSFAREVEPQHAIVKADIEGGEARLLEGLATSGAVLDFVCEVLEPAFECGFVFEAAATLNAEAHLISDGEL